MLAAVLVIRPEAAADPEFAERFNREARTLARLSHPHIVGIHVDQITFRTWIDGHKSRCRIGRGERLVHRRQTQLTAPAGINVSHFGSHSYGLQDGEVAFGPDGIGHPEALMGDSK